MKKKTSQGRLNGWMGHCSIIRVIKGRLNGDVGEGNCLIFLLSQNFGRRREGKE